MACVSGTSILCKHPSLTLAWSLRAMAVKEKEDNYQCLNSGKPSAVDTPPVRHSCSSTFDAVLGSRCPYLIPTVTWTLNCRERVSTRHESVLSRLSICSDKDAFLAFTEAPRTLHMADFSP